MINLLPQDTKQDLFYARRNTRLRAWIIANLVMLAGIGIIIAGGLIYLQRSIIDQSSQVQKSREALVSQNVDETQKRVEEISANTKLTVDVLSREILFSKLLRQIGAALPANTALQSLQIDAVKGGLLLNALSTDFTTGSQIQLNLEDPTNGVFEQADLNNITCTPPAADTPVQDRPLFPCTVSLQALFSKNNSYSYIAAPETPAPAPGAAQ